MLASCEQTNIMTSAGCIASALLLIYDRKQTTSVNYQAAGTKYLSFSAFHDKPYNTSRRFTCITKDNRSAFIRSMKSMCKKQFIFGLELSAPGFQHCFLVVGHMKCSFITVTRYHKNSHVCWALLSEEAIENHKVRLLTIHDNMPLKKCRRFKKHLQDGVYIPAPFPLYDRLVCRYA